MNKDERVKVCELYEKAFGRAVKNAREAKRLKQIELGDMVGISQEVVSRIENAYKNRHIYLSDALLICKALDINMSELEKSL